ncbi:MAG TPA: tetratricopeptide repeat protein, partial [Pirellulales bacterium]|nr:tetratricopeptide repeat protein [Pirellulales bacterium]
MTSVLVRQGLGLLLIAGCFAGCTSKRPDFSNVPFSQLSDMQPVRNNSANPEGTSITPAAFAQPGPKIDSDVGTSVKDVKPKEGDDNKTDNAWWTSFKPSNISKGWKKLIHQDPNETIARQAYADGNELFQHGQFAEAAKLYKRAYKRWPDTDLEEDAMFMRAEALFFSDQYYKANDTYAMMLKKHENSRHLDKTVVRYFAIARYWEEEADKHLAYLPNFTDKKRPYLDLTSNAIACYEAIRINDPTGPLADDALFAECNAYYRGGRFEDADYHFDLLRKEYPRSKHQQAAHLIGLRAKLRTYQGAEYEERPLVEAEKLIDSTLVQFVADIPEERERLLHIKTAIRSQKAERQWSNAEYYYHRKYYRAARMYYNELLKRFPDTSFAELAQKRLEETKNYPPVPKNHFAWLGRIFGERGKNSELRYSSGS